MNNDIANASGDFILKLRDYQERIFKKCVKENLIVCLPTGSGKTMIAIELIKHLLPQTLGKYPTIAKRTFFLAPKRVLVVQQYHMIEKFLTAKILMLTGDDEPDKFDKQQWTSRLKKNQVFVVTPDILLDILSKGYIKVCNLNLIIFDEMHWAFRNGTEPSNHPYARIMNAVKAANNMEQPRILCLSASIFANDSQSILESANDSLKKIEQLYRARIESGGFSYAHKYKEELLEYKQTYFDDDIGFDFDRLFRIFAELKNASFLKQFHLAFMKIKKIISGEMGFWFAMEYIKLCSNSLNDNHFEISDIMMKIMKYIDKRIRHWLYEHKGIVYDENKYQPILTETDFISNKLKSLLNLIEKFRIDFSNQSFTGILFVSERTDANLIFRWLKLLSKNDENFAFLKLGFICGSFTKDFLHFDYIHSNSQYLSKLRNNQVNFIIATSVLEEGIDVPICNVVIRYDGVDNYRAYCQSRGRARHDNSYFYIMALNSEAKKVKKKLINYRKIDDLLVNIKSPDYIDCFEREFVNQNNDDDDDDFFHQNTNDLIDEDILSIQPYQNGQSTLHPLGSLQLLNKYLMKLPRDLFTTQQMPLEMFVKLPVDPRSNNIKYAYIFIFPINSNYAGTVIKGGYFQSKKSAAMHCAFRACKFLIDHGDIDENLNVFQKRFILEQHSSELNIRYVKGLDDEDQFQTRQHKNKTSDYFQALIDFDPNVNTDFIYYLYALEFKAGSFDPSNLKPEQQSQLYKPFFISTDESTNDNQTVGLLLSQKHPIDFVQSYFYFNLFPIKFQLRYCDKIDLSDPNKLNSIEYFHNHVFNMIFSQRLKLDQSLPLNRGLYIVPMKKQSTTYNIDFEFIQILKNWEQSYNETNKDIEKVAPDSLQIDQIKVYNSESNKIEFDDEFTIFSAIHQRSIHLYFAKNISDRNCMDFMIPPSEEFPSGQTYAQFYQKQYDRIIRDQETPMVNGGDVKSFQINYHLFRQKCTMLKPMNRNSTLFPLELITIHPFTSRMYLRIASIPILLYRLEQYALGKEFLSCLHDCIDLNYDKEHFDVEDILSRTKKIQEVLYREDDLEELPMKLLDVNSIVDESKLHEQEHPITKKFKSFLIEELEKTEQTPKTNTMNVDQEFVDDDIIVDGDKDEQEQLFIQLLNKINEIQIIKDNKNFKRKIDHDLLKTEIEFGQSSFFKFTGNIDEYIDKNSLSYNTFLQFDCPNPWHIVQGLTLTKAYDSWNIERLETIGDSFIKFTCSLYLFFQYPDYDEMKFDCLKTSLINNKNLFKIAMEKKITQYIFCSLHQSIPLNYFKRLIIKNFVPTEQEFRHGLRYKDVADCIESLIGAFLVYGGAGTALKFLNNFLDLKSFCPEKLKSDQSSLNDFLNYKLNLQLEFIGPEIDIDGRKFYEIDNEEIEAKLLKRMKKRSLQAEVDRIYEEYSMHLLEEELQYEFRAKYLLVQAFNHPSMYRSEDIETGEIVYNFIPSYQRLEFIGDAILDYMMTRFIYHMDHELDPTGITLLKHALVNNAFYASITVKHGLHKFLRHSSIGLRNKIHKFVNSFTYRFIEQVEKLLLEGIDEEIAYDLSNVDIPKTLADVFESLVGAIFIDCHFDLDATWRIVYRMIKVETDHFMKNIPMMPLLRLSQFYHNCHFGPVQDVKPPVSDGTENHRSNKPVTDRRMIELIVDGVGTFIGYGKNKRQCKVSATKRFFAWEKQQQENENKTNNESQI